MTQWQGENGDRYWHLLQAVSEAVMIFDPETKQFVEVNDAALALYGYTREEFLRLKVTDISAEYEETLRSVAELMAGRLTRIPVRYHRKKDGTLFPVEISAGKVSVEGRDLALGVVRDITERQKKEDDNRRTREKMARWMEERTRELLEANRRLQEEIEERRRAELELQKSEERYRRITDAVTDYVFTVRYSGGRVAETIHGPNCVAVTGYSPEEFQAEPDLWIRMVPQPDRNLVEDQIAQIRAGQGTQVVEHRILRKDGEVRWVRNTSVPNYDAHGELLSYDGLIRDITERKLAEEKVRIRAVQQAAVASIGEYALAGEAPAALMERAARQVSETLEVEYCLCLQWAPSENALSLRAAAGLALDNQVRVPTAELYLETFTLHAEFPVTVENFKEETRFGPCPFLPVVPSSAVCVVIRLKRGIYGVLSAHAVEPRTFSNDDIHFLQSVAHILGLAVERHEMELALIASEERYRLAISAARHGLWDWDVDSNTVYVSLQGRALMGLPDISSNINFDEWIGRIHEDDREQVRQSMAEHLEDRTAHFEAEFRVQDRSGAWRWLLAQGIAIRARQGGAVRMTGTICDTTHQKEEFKEKVLDPLVRMAKDVGILLDSQEGLNHEVPSPRDELQAVGQYLRSIMSQVQDARADIAEREDSVATSEKLAKVGQLAASVAHEIRNPLTSLKMRFHSLRSVVGDDPEIEEDIEVIRNEIARLESIVTDFLDFARPRAPVLLPVPVEEALADAADAIAYQLNDRRVLLSVDVPSSVPPVMADKNQVKQVFINLMLNSIEAMPEGGEIRVTAKKEADARQDEKVAIFFMDTGRGIRPDIRHRLFEPFFTTKKDGTGLGLSISAQILERHRGRIELVESGDSGTIFAVWLPAAANGPPGAWPEGD